MVASLRIFETFGLFVDFYNETLCDLRVQRYMCKRSSPFLIQAHDASYAMRKKSWIFEQRNTCINQLVFAN